MDWKKEYEKRLVTAEEAIKNIHDNDKVVMHAKLIKKEAR